MWISLATLHKVRQVARAIYETEGHATLTPTREEPPRRASVEAKSLVGRVKKSSSRKSHRSHSAISDLSS